GLTADGTSRPASPASDGSSTVITGTLLGARSDDHTSSGNSLALAGTVITGIVDIADSVGPAPFERPMKAIITESGTSWIMRCSVRAAATGSLCTEQVTTETRSSSWPSACVNASVLSDSDPRHR